MKRYFIAVATLFVSAISVQAQNTSGILFNRDIIPASSILSLSQRDAVGRARSMAMGGAFTSLGGDMASFGYNPAGFGMYQRNEISASLGLGIAHAKNYNAYNTTGNNSVRAAVNNIGASFNIFEGTGTLTAVNVAIGYNKVADYNYEMSYEGPETISSLANAFADIANAGRLTTTIFDAGTQNEAQYITDPATKNMDYDMGSYYWSTVLGYKTGLISRNSEGQWYPDEVGIDALRSQYTNLKSRGSAGEFSFAFGFNVSNILYFGASLDVQSISRRQSIFYEEYIYYNGSAPSPELLPYQLRDFQFEQTVEIKGAGVGAKFGVVARPVPDLRIGVAVHTPSYYSVSYRYSASLASTSLSVGDDPNNWAAPDGYVHIEESTPILQDAEEYRWKFTTPTRVLAGISYTFSKYAIVSADYQYDAYKSLKLNYAPTDTGYDNSAFRDNLKGVHTLRVGVEAKPLPWLALRVGGGFKSKVLNVNYDFVRFSEPMEDSMWYASAGLGFRLSEVTSIDVAYQYRNARYSDYYSFYTTNSEGVNCSPLYGLDLLKHNIALTFAFRF